MRVDADEATGVESTLLALFNSLPALCTLKDEHGRVVYMNRHASSLFSPDKSASGATSDQLFPDETAVELEDIDRRVRDTREVVALPMWLPDVNGTRRHFAVLKFPVETPSHLYVGGIAINITPFSSTAWDESTYKQILDAISDMVVVKGPGSKLLWANKAFQATYGMTNAELQGIIEAPFVEPDMRTQYARDDAQVFKTGKSLDIVEEPMKHCDGRTLSVHTVKSPIFDEVGSVRMMVAVIRDITERKRLESDLHQAQKLESLGRLAAGMAHEINTPIQFIGDQRTFAEAGVADLLTLIVKYQGLVAKVAAGTATVHDAIAIRSAEEDVDLGYLQASLSTSFTDMGDGVARVARLVQALKEFGHPDDGTHELADINAAIKRTAVVATNEYRYTAELVLELAELPPTPCNPSELQQVVLNLIINAAHAIADLGRQERGTITVTTSFDEAHVEIRVRDTGCGIPDVIQRRVFDPFFTTKSVGRGTGQGLAIARMLVEKHHGTLTFETRDGPRDDLHDSPAAPACYTSGVNPDLVATVRRVLEETHAEYAQMPFFVRPLVRRGFAKRTGHDLAAWLRLLDAAARGETSPDLRGALDRLAVHYDTAPERAKRGMGARPDELREVERRSRERAAAVRSLVADRS